MKALNFGKTLRNAGTWLANKMGFGGNNARSGDYRQNFKPVTDEPNQSTLAKVVNAVTDIHMPDFLTNMARVATDDKGVTRLRRRSPKQREFRRLQRACRIRNAHYAAA